MSEPETTLDTAKSVLVRGVELRVAQGPDAGAVVRVNSPTFTIGKSTDATLRLSDDRVSREHLRGELGAQGLLLRDDGSKNGTWLGGLRLDRVLVTSDLALQVGTTLLEIRLDATATQLPVSQSTSFGEALGHSVAMRHVFAYLERASLSEVTVLLEGESGVGKEVLARAVHTTSPRNGGPFVAVDCGAIPGNLMESELFGHVRGAFTGAEQARIGLAEQADGGTLFLDEIGELPLDLQPKLLRLLERREVRPVGGKKERVVDVRFVAATNRNLVELVREGRFREDLYYRLAVAQARVPPLRERMEDIVPLATMMLRSATGDMASQLPQDLASLLRAYSWPGNVRELRNVVGRYALLGMRARQDLFDPALRGARMSGMPQAVGAADLSDLPYHEARRIVLDQLDMSYFPALLAKCGGVVLRATKRSGLARSSFYRTLERLGIAPERGE